jgi:histidinol-phosphate aminotransferase
METRCTFHGGKSFEAIGEDFQTLERGAHIVRADVLDAWFDPSPRVLEKLREFLPFLLRSSPPVHGKGLIEAIARARGVPEECVVLGGGSSDLIFTCLPKIVGAGQRVMILDPMYGEYRYVFEEVIGAEVLRFALEERDDFRIDTQRLIEAVHEIRPDIVTLVNPNSPTGQHWPRHEVKRFVDAIPEDIRVLVDETYIEYAGHEESIEREACARENLVVLKSMSKVYALSGLRVGYLIGAPDSARRMARWMPPWAVSLPAQVAAVEALADPEYYQARYCETHALREELARGLRAIKPVQVFPSRANFVLARVPKSAQQTLERMSKSNVYVRNCDSMGDRLGDRFIRVAVRASAENKRIAEALAERVSS